MDQQQSLIQVLKKGKHSTHQMMTIIQEMKGSYGGDEPKHPLSDLLKEFDVQSKVVLSTLNDALSKLQSFDNNVEDYIIQSAKKVCRTDNNNSLHHCKFEGDDTNLKSAATPTKDKRGCHRRRRNDQMRIVETPDLEDDGFAWRKYGQKAILNTQHPRCYYRCTHKHDQGCQATKQVQKISTSPMLYRTIYNGQHTCKNTLNDPPYLAEFPRKNSFILTFGTNNPTSKHALNNHPFIFTSSSSTDVVKHEMGSSGPSVPTHVAQNQYSCNSSDLTTTVIPSTPASEQGEVYSSTAAPHGMEMDYSQMMADCIDLDAVLQDCCVRDEDDTFKFSHSDI